MLFNKNRALDVMERHNLDALVATTPENVYYLSGFGASHSFLFRLYGASAAVFPRDPDIPATLLIPEQDVPYLIENPTWMPDVRIVAGGFGPNITPSGELSAREKAVQALWGKLREKGPLFPNRQKVLGAVLTEVGLAKARLGVDDPRVITELNDATVAQGSATDAFNVFREIRIVKTDDEIDLMRRAAQINETCLNGAANLLVEGQTMREVARFWRSSMALQGAVGEEFYAGGFERPWFIAPDSYRLKEGDHVLLDCAGTYKYYWADVGRTGCVGKPTQRVEEIYGVAREVHRTCLPLLRPGTSTVEVKRTALDVAKKHGLEQGWTALMHTMGIEVYDMPQPLGETNREDFTLEKDMVVSYECCFYAEFPWGTVQLEDTFLIGDQDASRLGFLSHDLMGPGVRAPLNDEAEIG